MIKPIIRSATAADLAQCLSFDPSFETEYVWQMDSRVQDGQISIAFRTVRLPRAMKVSYPRDVKQLNAGWNACDAMLVLASGSYGLEYARTFSDYRQAETKAIIRGYAPKHP